jgi:carboxymethylenebutenolidase
VTAVDQSPPSDRETPDPSPVRVLTESVRIPVAGEAMGGYLARPAHAAGAPAVIVAMELFGVSAHIRDVCDRLAALGFVALAPDLYHRSDPGVELAADDQGRSRGFELLGRLTRDQVLADVGATIAFLGERALPFAGVVGLSVGGHVAYLAAGRLEIPATVVLYGGWIPTTDIAISRPEPTIAATATITGRLLMLVGTDDPVVPADHRLQVADALRDAGIKHELVEYPGVGHGFLCDRRDGYDRAAATDAWLRIATFLRPA